MRVALIDPSLFTIPYDRELASGLIRLGHKVVLYGRPLRSAVETIAPVPLAKMFYRLAESRLGQKLPASLRLGLKGFDHGWSMWQLLRHLRRDPPDVIHFQWLPLPLLDRAFLTRLRQVAPIVLTVHDTNPFNGDPSAKLQSRGVHQCLLHFDRLIVHTKQGEERLRRSGVPGGKIVVLPHGMLGALQPGVADPMQGKLTFLLFGKIRPYKGADVLIKAFAALPPSLRGQARIRIIGKPYIDVQQLHAEAQALGVEVDIETGFVDDAALPEVFGAGTVAMFPYREIEASGVLFLALAHGRPIIASSLGSFAELLTDGVQGHLVPPGDVAALAAAMQHMLQDRVFAADAAAAVRAAAGSIPSWDQIAESTVTVYSQAG